MADATHAIDQLPGPVAAAAAMVGGALGPFLAIDVPWPLRIPIGAAGGLLIYWVVPTCWALIAALRAPPRQREEARKALREERKSRAESEARLRDELARNEQRKALREKIGDMLWSATTPLRYIASGTATPEQAAESIRRGFDSVAQTIREEGAQHGVAELADRIKFNVPDSPTAEQVRKACDEPSREIGRVLERLAN